MSANPNRLARETSPYLLQHAHNPVDWHPWGREAIELAARRDVPILLSIGYSACHWCHVMERESFEDESTAALMNHSFVSVKVDREERPDIDSIYMAAVQALTGQGGWPLTAFLTPAGAPFHGGTYFPPEPRHGMPSFRQLLAAVSSAWADRRAEVDRAGAHLTEVLRASTTRLHPAPDAGAGGEPEVEREGAREAGGAGGDAVEREGEDHGSRTGRPRVEALVRGAVDAAARTFDASRGGFGGAPKFPQPVFLDFLLQTGERGAAMAVRTLERMSAGGIRDHVGGGFHRYSVDARWLVPHFEKMLYDNALIARALTRAHQLGAPGTGRVAAETLDYVLEDLRSPEGAFYSARDADSEDEGGRQEEGAYYVWSRAEALSVLSEECDRDEAELFCRAHDISEAGNFEGRSIVHLPHDLDLVAAREKMERARIEEILARGRAALLKRRSRRPPPLRDEKILTSWNGFAIRALAEAGGALDRPDYVAAAERAARFLLGTVRRDGRLHRVCTAHAGAAGGLRVHVDGFLEDYGALGVACLALHDATGEDRWLNEAASLLDVVLERFWTPADAVFHDVADDAEPLVVRPRDVMDNATPSGSALAVELAVGVARATGRTEVERVAERVLERERGAIARYPLAMGHHLAAALRLDRRAAERPSG